MTSLIPRSRRKILGTLAGGAAFLSSARSSFASLGEARLAFHNIHTGERLDRVYRTQAGYDPGALADIDKVLRDFRTGDVHPIAPALLDLVHDLSAELGGRVPFDVISGYRSPQTNAKLHAASNGVASHSFHMKGMAIDLAAPGHDVRELHAAALRLKRGGVGLYEASGFVHVDVGPLRTW